MLCVNFHKDSFWESLKMKTRVCLFKVIVLFHIYCGVRRQLNTELLINEDHWTYMLKNTNFRIPDRRVSQVFICSDRPQDIWWLQRCWCTSTTHTRTGTHIVIINLLIYHSTPVVASFTHYLSILHYQLLLIKNGIFPPNSWNSPIIKLHYYYFCQLHEKIKYFHCRFAACPLNVLKGKRHHSKCDNYWLSLKKKYLLKIISPIKSFTPTYGLRRW